MPKKAYLPSTAHFHHLTFLFLPFWEPHIWPLRP